MIDESDLYSLRDELKDMQHILVECDRVSQKNQEIFLRISKLNNDLSCKRKDVLQKIEQTKDKIVNLIIHTRK